MEKVSCRYRTDENGKLICYNACPLYVGKMYELKESVLQLGEFYYAIDMVVKELEHNLFENDGRNFLEWLKENATPIREMVSHIGIVLFESSEMYDTLEVKEIKTKILKMLEDFII